MVNFKIVKKLMPAHLTDLMGDVNLLRIKMEKAAKEDKDTPS